VLKGGGGNTAVFKTMRGIVVVDAKNPGWGQPILDKTKTPTDQPVVMLIKPLDRVRRCRFSPGLAS